MPIHNSEIADVFNQVADLLAIKGANQFRIRAYRNAARTVENLPRSVRDMIDSGEDLTELEGIGKDLAGKIKTIVDTGKLPQLQELEEEIPAGLTQLLRVPGLGPKRVQAIFEELKLKTLDDVKKAAEEGKLQEVEGIGEKTEQQIVEKIEQIAASPSEERLLLNKAENIAEPLVDYIKQGEGVNKVVIAGSYRRRKETIGDLDILVLCDDAEKTVEYFAQYEDVTDVASTGTKRTTVILRGDFQVDLRLFDEESFGAAMLYFTGSKAHNIAVRRIIVDKGMKLNEYGVWKDEEQVAGKTEEDVYAEADMAWVPPEMREDRGEVDMAREGELPDLIEEHHLHGDLQMHTTRTDGKNSLREMAEAAAEMGHDYIAITDHSQRVTVAGGLKPKEIEEQMKEIEKLNDDLDDLTVLKGIEVDILEDGSLDVPDSLLAELDIVVCSVHYQRNLSREKQTKRILKAMENDNFMILGHPTGRLIGQREGMDLDVERLIQAAEERDCWLEINAQPDRLDLNDIYSRAAKEAGVRIAISTDAHSTAELRFLRYGVDQARRGWLEPVNVVNTRTFGQLKKLLKKRG